LLGKECGVKKIKGKFDLKLLPLLYDEQTQPQQQAGKVVRVQHSSSCECQSNWQTLAARSSKHLNSDALLGSKHTLRAKNKGGVRRVKKLHKTDMKLM